MAKGKWIKRAEPPHPCSRPLHTVVNDFQPGSIWECDCGQRWTYTSDFMDGNYWAKSEKPKSQEIW